MPDDLPARCKVATLLQNTLASGELERRLRSQHRQWEHVLDYGEFREEVLGKAWERQSGFQGKTSAEFLAWLRRIAWSVAVDAWRRRKRYSNLLKGFARLLSPVAALPASQRVETRDLVQWLLAGLTARERKILILKYFENMPTDRLAEELETTREGVLQLHYRAIAKLRERAKKSETGR